MNNKICILEDNEVILKIVRLILEKEGYEVDGFVSISTFLEAYQKIGADLYLLDVMLPDGSGLDVCELIRKNKATAQTPIVIMTANSKIEQMKEECEADDFIAKPFDIDYFTQRVKILVNKRNLSN